MHVYAIDKEYYNNNSVSIDELIEKKIIKPKVRYTSGQEVVFESSIPAEYVYGYQLFSLPSFKEEWNEKIVEHYGIEKNKYVQLKELFCSNTESIKNKENAIKELIISVTKHQVLKLKEAMLLNENQKKDKKYLKK